MPTAMDDINYYINMANEQIANAMAILKSIDGMNAKSTTVEKSEDDVKSEETTSVSVKIDDEIDNDDEKNRLLQEDRNLADDLADVEKKLSELDAEYDKFMDDFDAKRSKFMEERCALVDKKTKIMDERNIIHKTWCEKHCEATKTAKTTKSESKVSKPKIPSTAKILNCLETFFEDKFTAADPYSSLNKLLNGKIKTIKFISITDDYDLYAIADVVANSGETELSNEVRALADYYANEKKKAK